MVLQFPLSCFQSTTPVTVLSITADGGDGADYDGNAADAWGYNANNKDDRHANRENGILCLVIFQPWQQREDFPNVNYASVEFEKSTQSTVYSTRERDLR